MDEPTELSFKIGDRIVSTAKEINGQLGTVRWIGAIPGTKGTWYGVELDNPAGKHDGKVQGVKYFDCKAKHGIFLKEKNMIAMEFEAPPQITQQDEVKVEENISPDIKQEKIESPSQIQSAESESVSTEAGEKTLEVEASDNDEEKVSPSTKKNEVEKTAVAKTGIRKETKIPTKVIKEKEEQKTTTVKKVGKPEIKKTTTNITDKTKSNLSEKQSSEDLIKIQAEYQENIDNLTNQLKAYQDELSEKDEKLANNETEIIQLNNNYKQLQSKYAQLEAAKVDEFKKMEELDSEYKKKFRETHSQLQEIQKEKKELEYQVKKLQREIESSHNSEELMESLILEKDELTAKVESYKEELEQVKNKVIQLEEEKEILQLEKEEALTQSEGDSDVGQLKIENVKLKQALEKIYDQYEVEKKKSDEKLAQMALKLQGVAQIEEKEKQIKLLNEEIKKKDNVIEDLKLRIDDAEESIQMVEKLSEELLNKDDEIIELRREIMKVKKEFETDEQLVEEQDEYLKVLEEEALRKEVEINNLKSTIETHLTAVSENEKVLNKYRDKIQSLTEENKLLKEKNSEGKESKLYSKIDELSKKQIELLNSIRENYKKEVNSQLENISAKNDVQKYTILLSVLPRNLKEKMNIDSLNRFFQLIQFKDKIDLLTYEIRKKYIQDQYHAKENLELIFWLKDLLLDFSDMIHLCDLLEKRFYSFDSYEEVDNYINFAKSPLFNQLLALNSILDQLFHHVKEDTLSVKFQVDTLKLVLSKISEACADFEDQFDSLGLRFKKLVNQTVAQGLELCGIGINKGYSLKKITDIVEKLNELGSKLEGAYLVQASYDGFEEKIEALISLKYSMDSFAQTLQSCTSVDLDELESECEKAYSKIASTQIKTDTDHVNTLHKGPWNHINNELRGEIEQVSETAINYEKANSQLKEQMKNNLLLQNEIKDINNIKTILEKRVADLQAKAEKVVQLEIEKKRHMEREVHFTEATEKIRQRLEEAEKKVKNLDEENQKLKQTPIAQDQSTSGRPRPTNARTPMSSTLKTNFMNFSDKLNKDMLVQTDVEDYLQIISKLTTENMSIKSGEMKTRIKSLDQTMPAFARCMEKYNLHLTTESSSIELSDNDQAKICSVIKKAKELDDNIKQEICKHKIISLSDFKTKSKLEKEKVISDYLQSNSNSFERINYEVLSASSQFLSVLTKVNPSRRFKSFLQPDIEKMLLSSSDQLFAQIHLPTVLKQNNNNGVAFGTSQLQQLKEIVF